MGRGIMFTLLCLSAMMVARAEDPYFFFTWNVTYGTISPLGVPQQGILINGQFPGPNINSTSNNNIVINVFNNLDEPFLLTWSGIQHRKNSWQDGVLGTNCPIPPGKNFTYHFQVKDQIGSYFYYPTTAVHRAAGAFGGLRVNSRLLIPVPYADPEDDYTVLIGDWYTKSHTTLRKFLDSGRSIGRPDGVLINGKNANGDGKDEPTLHHEAWQNLQVQRSHTVQNTYESLDVHVGQCFSFLVTADKDPKDYYMVASTRFTKTVLTGKGIIRYTNGNAPASSEIPEAPVGWAWSLNQFRSFRWNLTASAARPNPQGSYHYGSINITRTIKLVNSASNVDGKLRYAINGVSHVDPVTPLKLAEYFGVNDKVFKYDTISDEPPATFEKVTVVPNVVNATFRTFIEIIFENHEKNLQSWHLDGYSFFAVAVEPGRWTPEKRKNYNLLDAVSRHTIQVFPKSWAAIMLTFDNAGMWNLRSELTENRYLGQQLYISVLSPERSLRDEYNIPEDTLLCGLANGLPKPPPYTI
ncbi:L-ascorbate oxidase-like [Quillaja saponaria]|uniref:L-ascorbate oxidase-like n=1 Tax=Quillaja saponaria TaxID=32244 RepID=A0AAD7LC92_QUISA|nr:L-ascorbate oxidase-like [Quillaja saponaria]